MSRLYFVEQEFRKRDLDWERIEQEVDVREQTCGAF